jgi:Asp-tRNA(Asn)/Glu-tRNA(Gln) amidotransferase A subunit family amidase
MQLIGPHLGEAPLLKAAHAYQQATAWHLQRPAFN